MEYLDNRKSFFEAVSEKVNIGSYDEFLKKIESPDNRKNLFDALSESYNIGTFEEYESKLGFSNQDTLKQDTPIQATPNQKSYVSGGEQAFTQSDEALRQDKPANKFAELFRNPHQENYFKDISNREAREKDRISYVIDPYQDDDLTQFTPKKEQTYQDIMINQSELFKATPKGQEAYSKLMEKQTSVLGKYIDKYKNTPEYRRHVENYQKEYSTAVGDEQKATIDKKYNALLEGRLHSLYGTEMNTELEPAMGEYLNALYETRQTSIDGATQRLGRTYTQAKLPEIKQSINDALSEHQNSPEYKKARDKEFKRQEIAAMFKPELAHTTFATTELNLSLNPVMRQLNAAKKRIEKSEDMIEAALQGKGLGAGFIDQAKRINNWTYGFNDFIENSDVRQVIEKAEKDENSLTKSEKALLDAVALEACAIQYFSYQLSRGYKAGTTTAASVPFMIEFMVNPLSGAGRALAKTLGGWAIKRGITGFGLKSLTFGSRMLGDMLGAAGMTATSSIGRVASGVEERMIGNVGSYADVEGVHFAGREGEQTFGEAVRNSVADNLVENYSEMFFGAFEGGSKAIRSFLKSSPLKGLPKTKVFEIAKNLFSSYDKLQRAVQFHGYLGEVSEEYIGNLLRLGVTTDTEASDVFNEDAQIDTWLGLLPTSVAFGIIGVSGRGINKYSRYKDTHRMNYDRFKASLSSQELTSFENVEAHINAGDTEFTKNYIKETLHNKELNDAQKIERLNAVYGAMYDKNYDDFREVEIASIEERLHNNHYNKNTNGIMTVATDKKSGNIVFVTGAADNGELIVEGIDGKQETVPADRLEDMKSVDYYSTLKSIAEGEFARRRVERLYKEGDEVQDKDGNNFTVSQLSDNGVIIKNSEGEEAEVPFMYFDDNFTSKAEVDIDKADAEIDKQTNSTNGRVTNVKIGGKEGVFYIKAGNLVAYKDDNDNVIIDKEHSDETFVVVDAETGEAKQVGINQIDEVLGDAAPIELKEQSHDEIRNAAENKNTFPVGALVYNEEMPNVFTTVIDNGGYGFSIATVNEKTGRLENVPISNDAKEGWKTLNLSEGNVLQTNLSKFEIISNEGNGNLIVSIDGGEAVRMGTAELSERLQYEGFNLPSYIENESKKAEQKEQTPEQLQEEQTPEQLEEEEAPEQLEEEEDDQYSDADLYATVKALYKKRETQEKIANKPIDLTDQKAIQARKTAKKNVEQLTEELAKWQAIINKRDERKKAERIELDKQEAEKKKNNMHNRIVQLIREYNGLPANYTQKKKVIFAEISKKASQLGYSTIMLRGGQFSVVDKEGKPIRTIAQRTSQEEINEHKLLTEYAPEFQEFALKLMQSMPEMLDFPNTNVEKAVKDITAGVKSVAANRMLDRMEEMYSSNEIIIPATALSPELMLDIPSYFALFEPETDNEIRSLNEMLQYAPEEFYFEIYDDLIMDDNIDYINQLFEQYGYEQQQERETRTYPGNQGESTQETIGGNAEEGISEKQEAELTDNQQVSETEKAESLQKSKPTSPKSIEQMAEEEARRKEMSEKRAIAEGVTQKLNIDIEFVENPDELPDSEIKARRAIQEGEKVGGWYNPKTNKAYLYIPNVTTANEVEKTILHEVVAHKGLRGLLGKEQFNALCDSVWQQMTGKERLYWTEYVLGVKTGQAHPLDIARAIGSQANRRAAADEFMANMAENGIENKTAWQKIVEFVKDALRKMGFGKAFTDRELIEKDIKKLLSKSYKRQTRNKENSITNEKESDVRFRFVDNTEYIKDDLEEEKNKYGGKRYKIVGDDIIVSTYFVVENSDQYSEIRYVSTNFDKALDYAKDYYDNDIDSDYVTIDLESSERAIPISEFKENNEEIWGNSFNEFEGSLENYIDTHIDDYLDNAGVDVGYETDEEPVRFVIQKGERDNKYTDKLIWDVEDEIERRFGVKVGKYSSFYVNREGNITDAYEDEQGRENLSVTMRISDHTHNPANGKDDLNVLIADKDATSRRFFTSTEDLVFNSDYTADEIVDEIEEYWRNYARDNYNGDELDIRFRIGKRARQEAERLIKKRNPNISDENLKESLDFLHSLEDNKENNKAVKIAIKWLSDDSIRLPFAMDNVRKAIDIAEKNGIDPMQYSNPIDIIEAFAGEQEKIEYGKYINPDDIEAFTNKRIIGEGENSVAVYDVEDSDDGLSAVTHVCHNAFGYDTENKSSLHKWCLSSFTRQGEPTDSASKYWFNTYNSVGKKIAFQDGKPIAFMAHDKSYEGDLWWDLKDQPSNNLPLPNGDYLMPDGEVTEKKGGDDAEELDEYYEQATIDFANGMVDYEFNDILNYLYSKFIYEGAGRSYNYESQYLFEDTENDIYNSARNKLQEQLQDDYDNDSEGFLYNYPKIAELVDEKIEEYSEGEVYKDQIISEVLSEVVDDYSSYDNGSYDLEKLYETASDEAYVEELHDFNYSDYQKGAILRDYIAMGMIETVDSRYDRSYEDDIRARQEELQAEDVYGYTDLLFRRENANKQSSESKTLEEYKSNFENPKDIITFALEENTISYGSKQKANETLRETVRNITETGKLRDDSGRKYILHDNNAQSGSKEPDSVIKKVTKRTVLKDFKESGFVEFAGTKIESPQDIADLFSIHRSPNIEKFHLIFVDDKGVILGTHAYTINLSNQALLPNQDVISDTYRKYNASGVYFLHNHPSGNHKVSLQDVASTDQLFKKLAEAGQNLIGHVVIDTDKFSYINISEKEYESDSYNQSLLNNYINEHVEEYEYKNAQANLFSERESIGSGKEAPRRLLEISKALLTANSSKGAIVYLTANLNVAAYDVFPDSAKESDIIKIAEQGYKNNLGSRIAFVHDGSYSFPLRMPHFTLDVIDIHRGSMEFVTENIETPTINQLWESQSEYGKGSKELEAIAKEMETIKDKAIADGTFMQAPNGNPTNLNEKQWLQVRTKNFKDWFGDWLNDPENASKVIDENGEPLVVYHGTSDRFTEFKHSELRGREGSFFFAQNKEDAMAYSGDGFVMPVFLSIQNPIDYENMPSEITRLPDKKAQVEALKNFGYDGWYANIDTGWGEYSAFYPNQIKSATDNVGTFDSENNDIRFRIGNKRKADMKAGLLNKLTNATEEQVERTISEIEKLGENVKVGGDSKTEKVVYHWALKGSVILPEDNDKILQAIKVAEISKVNPMEYNSPMELINNHDHIKLKEKPIDPDTVPTLTNKQDLGNGITVYNVDESEESRENMRKIINTHLGTKRSPWCLLQADENGKLTSQSAKYWKYYNGIPKRVAFYEGRLIAFSANDSNNVVWWDKQDKPTKGIPITHKIPNDELERTGTTEYNEETGLYGKFSNIHKGNKENGIYEKWNDNGQMSLRATYKDSKENGLYEKWLDNGQRYYRATYKDGKENGLSEAWHDNGQMFVRTTYKDGKKDGLFESWHDNGQPAVRGKYKDGELDGLREEWHYNGQMSCRITYKDGEENGLYEEWYNNGQMFMRTTFKDGEENGLYEKWYDNGQRLFRGIYKDGKRNGLSEEWYNNGQLSLHATYKDGKLNGFCEEWHENGQLKTRATYKDGKEDGLYELWYDNGQRFIRATYKDGKRNGLDEQWYDNGQLDTRATFKDGARNGLYEQWLPNKNLLDRAIYYSNGERKSLPTDVSLQELVDSGELDKKYLYDENEGEDDIRFQKIPEPATPSSITDAIKPDESIIEYAKRQQAMFDGYSEERQQQIRDAVSDNMEKGGKLINRIYKNAFDANQPLERLQKNIQKQGGMVVNGVSDAYNDHFRSLGRATTAYDEFHSGVFSKFKNNLQSLSTKQLPTNIRWADKKNMTQIDKITLYLRAKDMVEAKSLGLPNRGEEGFAENVRRDNSYMTKVTPEEYVEEFERAVGTEDINLLWENVQEVNQWTLNYMEKNNFTDESIKEKYNRKYYVPQRGFEEGEAVSQRTRGRESNSNFNPALRKAKGRKSLSESPLAHMAQIAQSTIMQVEKNNTKRQFLNFCIANMRLGRVTGEFSVDKVHYKKTGRILENGLPEYEEVYGIIPYKELEQDAENRRELRRVKAELAKEGLGESERSLLEKRAKQLSDAIIYEANVRLDQIRPQTKDNLEEHRVEVLYKGKRYSIFVNDVEVANALNRKDGEMGKWMKFFSTNLPFVPMITKYFSRILTQQNPSFALWNLLRDTGMGYMTNIVEHPNWVATFTENLIRTQSTIADYAFRGKLSEGEMGDYLKEFFAEGAQTGFSFINRMEDLKRQIKRELNVDNTLADKILEGGNSVLQFFSNITEWSELTVRFSQYVTAREHGMTPAQAATEAKEVSVNFDRKGKLRLFYGLFSFFNATMQGSNKMIRQWNNGHKIGLALYFSAHVASGVLNTLLMPDDPEDEKGYGEYDRMINIVIGSWRIPLPQGLRAFHAIGVQIALAMQGQKTLQAAIMDALSFVFGEWLPINPIDGFYIDPSTNRLRYRADLGFRSFVPTFATPIYDVVTNTTYSGGTVHREPFVKTLDVPATMLSKKGVNGTLQELTDKLFELGGGNLTRKTMMRSDGTRVSELYNWNPSDIEFLTKAFTGGVGQFAMDMFDTGYNIVTGNVNSFDDFAATMPVVKRAYKPYKEETSFNSAYYELLGKIKAAKESYNTLPKERRQIFDRAVSVMSSVDVNNPTKANLKSINNVLEDWNINYW